MISVIITAYNVESYIGKALQSVMNQSYTDIEIIVVLDKPTDNTEQIVNRFAKLDKRIVVLKNSKNLGAGLSRRNGIAASLGEYTLLLDGDDYITPNFIEDLYKAAVEHDADIVSGGIQVEQNGKIISETNYGSIITTGTDKVAKFWGEQIVFMNNKLIRRKLHEIVPYCERRYIEDTPVIIPQLWYANKVVYVENTGYIYRMRDTSLTHTTNQLKDIIYKGLCWCDLMEFFNTHDKTIFTVLPVKEFIGNILKLLNSMIIKEEDIAPYKDEWGEFTRRLINCIAISNINFKEVTKQ